MRRSILLILASLPVFATSCNSVEIERRHLVVSGSESFAPLLREVADRFQALHPGVRVDVATDSADRVVAETREGLVDVALVGRALRPEDGLRGVEIAKDGLAFIAHPSNSVPTLDERQLVGLLTRVYTDWNDVGGSSGRVVVVGAADGQALRTALLSRFQLDTTRVPLDVALYQNAQVIDAIAHNPHALGYASLAAVRDNQAVQILPLGGVEATPENVRNGRYPYARPLVLASRAQANELAATFIEFAQSPEVRDLIHRHGFASTQP
jgi:phosphate transport system substrate-binding protein